MPVLGQMPLDALPYVLGLLPSDGKYHCALRKDKEFARYRLDALSDRDVEDIAKARAVNNDDPTLDMENFTQDTFLLMGMYNQLSILSAQIRALSGVKGGPPPNILKAPVDKFSEMLDERIENLRTQRHEEVLAELGF